MAGLLAPLPTNNCWTIAEHAGDDGPGGMQDLIGRARWDDAHASPCRCAGTSLRSSSGIQTVCCW